MKTSLWKLILVFGAILVGAALMVPKAFRDKPEKTIEQVSSSAQMVSPYGETEERVKPAIIGFHEAAKSTPEVWALCVDENICPPKIVAYPFDKWDSYLLGSEKPFLTNSDFIDFSISLEQTTNKPVINFRLTAAGARKMCTFSSEHISDPYAIIIDGNVIATSEIMTEICGGNGYIEVNFTVKEAQDLALALNAGTTPPKQRVVD